MLLLTGKYRTGIKMNHLERQDKKPNMTLRIIMAAVAIVAVAIAVLYAFGVFNKKTQTDRYRVYYLLKEYSFDRSLETTEENFTLLAELDGETLKITCIYDQTNDKVVSVEPFAVVRKGYLAEVSRGGQTLTLINVEYSDGTSIARYDASEALGEFTIKNLVVTEKIK